MRNKKFSKAISVAALLIAFLFTARPAAACMAWVEQVENNSNMSLTLLQNDPTWHPISNGRRYWKDEPISVAPGSRKSFSYFVIPWVDYGRLRIRGPHGYVDAVVGPKAGAGGDDFLRFTSNRFGRIEDIKLGPRGNQFVCSARFKMVFDNQNLKFEYLGQGPEARFGFLGPISNFIHNVVETLNGSAARR